MDLFQAGAVQGNVTVAVGVIPHAGQLNFSIIRDTDAVPDLQAFAGGLAGTLIQLGAQIAAHDTGSRC